MSLLIENIPSSFKELELACNEKGLLDARFKFYFESLGTENENKYNNRYCLLNKHWDRCFRLPSLWFFFMVLQMKYHFLHLHE
jgi:hypothetical protein